MGKLAAALLVLAQSASSRTRGEWTCSRIPFGVETGPGTKATSFPRRGGSVYEMGLAGFVEGWRGPLIRERSGPGRGADGGVMFADAPAGSVADALDLGEMASQCVVSSQATSARSRLAPWTVDGTRGKDVWCLRGPRHTGTQHKMNSQGAQQGAHEQDGMANGANGWRESAARGSVRACMRMQMLLGGVGMKRTKTAHDGSRRLTIGDDVVSRAGCGRRCRRCSETCRNEEDEGLSSRPPAGPGSKRDDVSSLRSAVCRGRQLLTCLPCLPTSTAGLHHVGGRYQ